MDSIFNFTRVDTFIDDINREDCFDTQDMDGTSLNYKVILVSDCADTVKDCIDEDGTLKTPYTVDDNGNATGVNIIETENSDDGLCALSYTKGINGARAISMGTSLLNYDFGINEVSVKGAFLVNVANGSGYVLAYAINNKGVDMVGTFTSPIDGMIWNLEYGR